MMTNMENGDIQYKEKPKAQMKKTEGAEIKVEIL